jgi:hypothetical protein
MVRVYVGWASSYATLATASLCAVGRTGYWPRRAFAIVLGSGGGLLRLPVHQYGTRPPPRCCSSTAAAIESWSDRRHRHWRPSWPQRADKIDYPYDCGSPKSPNCSIFFRAVCPWISIERGRDANNYHSGCAETRIELIPRRLYVHPLPQFRDNLGYLIFILPSTSSGASSS